MGSLIAFDLARQLRRGGCAEPAHLIVASRRAPQLSPGQDPLPDQLDDHDFARWVAERYGGMPEEILAEPSLLEAIVPCMRSDLRAHFDYRYREERPLSIPISAFSGIADPNVSETQLLGWREHTSASFAVQRFPGGHFFMQDRAADLFLQIQAIATDLLGS
jgi:surfactin synthase thioesterase subunit